MGTDPEEERQRGGRKRESSDEIGQEITCAADQPHLQRENQAEVCLKKYFWLIWGGKNMPIKPGARAVASGGFQVNPAAFCLKRAVGSDVTPENSGGVTH